MHSSVRTRSVAPVYFFKVWKEIVVVTVTLLSVLWLAGCSQPKTSGGGSTSSRSDSQDKRYPLTGVVLQIDAPNHQIRVHHEAIKDLMPAMTMDFDASPFDVENAKEGQHIRAELVSSRPGEFHLEKIWPADTTAVATINAAANALTQDTTIRGNRAYREVGENLPSFALYDQNGTVVQSSRFRGKQIMLNFIYTRCPIANMCPAATLRLQEAQKAAKAAGVNNLDLVTITLDPEYDTPGVLKEYASVRGIDTSNWSFLTGPESAIKSLFAQFGVFAEFEGSLLKHTLVTLLINEDGKIIHRADSSSWEVQEFVSKMKR